jgi:hypothetical protein
LYVQEHGAYPESLERLYEVGYVTDCPTSTDAVDIDPVLNAQTGRLWSYEYVGALPADIPEWTIIAYLRRGVQPGERLVLYADRARTVDWVPEDELNGSAGPGRLCMRTSYEGLLKTVGDALTPERRAELRRFYGLEDEADRRAYHLDLLDCAPADTWAVDFTRTGPSILEGRAPIQVYTSETPASPTFVANCAFHVATRNDDGRGSVLCGLRRYTGMLPEDMNAALAQLGPAVPLGRFTGYREDDGWIEVVLDEQTVAFGESREAAERMLTAWRKGPRRRPLPPELWGVADSLSGRVAFVAAIRPEGVSDEATWGLLPPYLDRTSGMQSLAAGLDLRGGIGVEVRAGFASDEAAAAAASQVLWHLAVASSRVWDGAEDAAPERIARLYDRVRVTERGTTATVGLHLSLAELTQQPELWWADLRDPFFAFAERMRPKTGPDLVPLARDDLHLLWAGLDSARVGEGGWPSDMVTALELLGERGKKLWVRPSNPRVVQTWENGLSSYHYVGSVPANLAEDVIICYSGKGDLPGGRVVLRPGSGTQFVAEKRLAADYGPARSCLRTSYKVVAAALRPSLTPERDAELRRFYEVDR